MKRASLLVLFAALLLAAATAKAQLMLPKIQSGPDSGYASNTVIDVEEYNGVPWLATSKGVNVTYDGGDTWVLLNTSSGLVSENVSAVWGQGTRVWLGTAHSESIDGQLMTISDGVSYSDDNGATWYQVDFSSSGQNINWVWGGDRTVYDITGHEDYVFFASFAGGFLGSDDHGDNWRRLYSSLTDSLTYNSGGVPEYSSRYFSCAADTSHGDSLFVWAGTAGGLFQYVFVPLREKPASSYINRIIFGSPCPDSGHFFIAGSQGVTRGKNGGGPWLSRFVEDGLPGRFVTALAEFDCRLFAGTFDPETDASTGLAYSDDQGDTYQAVSAFNAQNVGPNKRITDFAVIDSRLYMAAQEAGLLVSADTGLTWERILLDSSEVQDHRNTANALAVWGDTLLVGTDSGLVEAFLDDGGAIDSSYHHEFLEDDTSAARIIRVKIQPFVDSTGALDSLAYWTAHRPLTPSGRPMVGRRSDAVGIWKHYQVGVNTNDVSFWTDTAFVVGEAGIRFTSSGRNPGSAPGGSEIYHVEEKVSGIVVGTLDEDVITCMEVRDSLVVFGTNNGFAVSRDCGATYSIRRINTDPLKADLVINHNEISALGDILGNFMPAVEVQYIADEPARVWLSNRDVNNLDESAITVGRVVPVDADGNEVSPDAVDQIASYEHRWKAAYDEGFAWNYAFNGDSVFAATDNGLLFMPSDTGIVWDTVQLVDSATGDLVLPGTAVYGVKVIDDYLWVGTEDRTVRIDVTSAAFSDQRPFWVIDSATARDQVYAFPVPFSHAYSGPVEFHFVVDQSTNITIEIYDFAMNLVRRVVDNRPFPAGIYPATGSLRPIWDGRNGKGEQVAVGVYYFKVEYGGGESRWGKLAVIP